MARVMLKVRELNPDEMKKAIDYCCGENAGYFLEQRKRAEIRELSSFQVGVYIWDMPLAEIFIEEMKKEGLM